MEPTPFTYQFYRTTRTAWEAMYQALVAAKKSIYWELYIFVDDSEGARFVDVLCEKARAGVEVKLILDRMGSFSLSSLALARLAGAGVEVRWYHHFSPSFRVGNWFNRLWHRNHRKVLIIDEEIGFVGGVNISAQFGDWYDLYLKLSGRMVRPLLRGFARSYVRTGGERRKVRHLLHPKLVLGIEEWKKNFSFIIHSPLYSRFSPVRRLFMQGLAVAKESFNLLTPYYVPDRYFLEMVSKARARGVKVDIFLPVQPDYKIMEWIARAYYGLTHKAGAKIYLLNKMNHGKALSIDDKAGFVGSANFTPRSFFTNEETGVYFNDENMVRDLNTILDDWREEAEPLEVERWSKRGWGSKFKEWLGKKFEKFV